jgi:hypothetical protein
MPEETVRTPDTELDSRDPGDDVQRRFRYQSTYAAILSLSLLDEESEFEKLFCEHHEDILVKRIDGSFMGVQVKTRVIEQGPFKAGDEQILKSLKRFMELERKYPELFSKYVLAANCGFWNGRKNSSNLHHLLEIIKDEDNSSVLDRSDLSSIKRVASEIDSVDSQIILNALRKIELQRGPGLDDYQLRLDKLLSERPELKGKRYDEIQKVSNALIERMFQASTLSYASPKRDYFALLDDPETAKNQAIIEGKRINRDTVLSIIQKTFSGEALLRTYESISTSELPRGMKKLELKMAAGGLSVQNIDLAKDYKYSTEVLLEEWLHKYGPEGVTKRYEHLSTIVRTECQEAYDAKHSDRKVFGEEMLDEIRQRLRGRHKEEYENLFGCNYEHLLGISGILTEECKVWWSVPFEVEEVVT